MERVLRVRRLVAALRVVGQSYFFIRLVGLILSCYYAYSTPKSRPELPMWSRLRKTSGLFMKVPTQCVVYGSPFPVVCYVLAHLLDAPFTYQILESRLITVNGISNFSLKEFVSYAVVQMRNVWLYTLGWHITVSASTSRWIRRNTHPNNGILGVPEFFLSAFSSVTLIAQYRSRSFRSTEILEMMVLILPDNLNRAWDLAKYRYNFGYRGRGSTFLGGVIIDLKFLTCLVLAVASVRVIHLISLYYWPTKRGKDKLNDSQWLLLALTPVPYSAGILWPTLSMCVHWTSDFFCIQDNNHEQQGRQPCQKTTVVKPLRVLPLTSAVLTQVSTVQIRNNSVSIIISMGTFRNIQHQINCLHERSDIVDANVAFMNILLMSDTLVYLRIMYGQDRAA
ncbi:hypothetical protein PF005_g17014 [Phytophthora fragariae]|uniref:Uncharacterized protein n=1 Tax=Phytophthora fragariae TaxID=53985 RepID=A0A6A3X6H0_9STRA|nr:hypothetical protein PF009_g18251 [Phytophthora fragariae]KAE8996310.1 hypothetical protein PF011_g15961 [Phytophthora fragariae]KAE9096018.1 hypothetical protein PF007_g17166 [Phytophthora fragariae]KAE9127108.1 hypothetical protein PF006_g16576 [Phytophthora fragariae]KAE9196099.1 hypothetical protein PF005_g17014 [Phytophthora fragariae]